jgi:hypothetical protein
VWQMSMGPIVSKDHNHGHRRHNHDQHFERDHRVERDYDRNDNYTSDQHHLNNDMARRVDISAHRGHGNPRLGLYQKRGRDHHDHSRDHVHGHGVKQSHTRGHGHVHLSRRSRDGNTRPRNVQSRSINYKRSKHGHQNKHSTRHRDQRHYEDKPTHQDKTMNTLEHNRGRRLVDSLSGSDMSKHATHSQPLSSRLDNIYKANMSGNARVIYGNDNVSGRGGRGSDDGHDTRDNNRGIATPNGDGGRDGASNSNPNPNLNVDQAQPSGTRVGGESQHLPHHSSHFDSSFHQTINPLSSASMTMTTPANPGYHELPDDSHNPPWSMSSTVKGWLGKVCIFTKVSFVCGLIVVIAAIIIRPPFVLAVNSETDKEELSVVRALLFGLLTGVGCWYTTKRFAGSSSQPMS